MMVNSRDAFNEMVKDNSDSSKQIGCGKEVDALGDIIVCGGVEDWICPECKKESKEVPKRWHCLVCEEDVNSDEMCKCMREYRKMKINLKEGESESSNTK